MQVMKRDGSTEARQNRPTGALRMGPMHAFPYQSALIRPQLTI